MDLEPLLVGQEIALVRLRVGEGRKDRRREQKDEHGPDRGEGAMTAMSVRRLGCVRHEQTQQSEPRARPSTRIPLEWPGGSVPGSVAVSRDSATKQTTFPAGTNGARAGFFGRSRAGGGWTERDAPRPDSRVERRSLALRRAGRSGANTPSGAQLQPRADQVRSRLGAAGRSNDPWHAPCQPFAILAL